MLFYNIGSIIKIIIGALVVFYLYNYVNIYEDPSIALIFGFFGIFLIVWGFSFYLFYIIQKLFSKKHNILIASKAYKLSLLLGIYTLINIGLIMVEKWSNLLGILILVIFIFVQIIIIKENDN